MSNRYIHIDGDTGKATILLESECKGKWGWIYKIPAGTCIAIHDLDGCSSVNEVLSSIGAEVIQDYTE